MIENRIWKEFKEEENKDFIERVKELTQQKITSADLIEQDTRLKSISMSECLLRDIDLFDRIYFADFETTTAESDTFKEYQQKTGRTKSEVNYFFMLRCDWFRKQNQDYLKDVSNHPLMIQGTTIDEMFDYFYNDTRNIDFYYIYFHNLNFDGKFIFDWLIAKGYQYKNHFGAVEKNHSKLKKQYAKNKETYEKKSEIILEEVPNIFTTQLIKGKFINITVYMQKANMQIVELRFRCSLKLLANISINVLGKSYNLAKKDTQIAKSANYKKFLSISHYNTLNELYNVTSKQFKHWGRDYIFYCMRDVFIQGWSMLANYCSVYTDLLSVYGKDRKELKKHFRVFLLTVSTTGETGYKLIKNHLLPKEQKKYMEIDFWDRLFVDKFTRGGLTTYNLNNELIIYTKPYIDSMKHKNVMCMDINSAYPHKMLYNPTNEIYYSKPDDYESNPKAYGVMLALGYTNLKPKKGNEGIGILKDYLTPNLEYYAKVFRKSIKDFNEILNIKISNANHPRYNTELLKDIKQFYNINVDNNTTIKDLITQIKNIGSKKKIGKLIESAKKIFVYATPDLKREIETFFDFDSVIVLDTIYYKLSNYLGNVMLKWYERKEKGNESERQNNKIKMNSTYGKQAQGFDFGDILILDEDVEIINENEIKFNNKIYEITNDIHKNHQIKLPNKTQKSVRLKELQEQKCKNKMIANWCTHQTTAQLMNMMNTINPSNFIYGDTDSIIANCVDESKVITGKKLGDWGIDFKVEFVKKDGYDGYYIKIFKMGDVLKKLCYFDKETKSMKFKKGYDIIEETNEYLILNKQYVFINIVFRQKTYYFGIIDLYNIEKYQGIDLLSIFNENDKDNVLSNSDRKHIISNIVNSYEDDKGNIISKHIIIKKAHSGIDVTPSVSEMYELINTGTTTIEHSTLTEHICDDGGKILIEIDKTLSENRELLIANLKYKVEYEDSKEKKTPALTQLIKNNINDILLNRKLIATLHTKDKSVKLNVNNIFRTKERKW